MRLRTIPALILGSVLGLSSIALSPAAHAESSGQRNTRAPLEAVGQPAEASFDTHPSITADEVELPSPLAGENEALEVAEDLMLSKEAAIDEGTPMIVGFTPRTSDDSHATALTARFPVPNGCVSTEMPLVLQCETGEVTLLPVALDGAGVPVPHEAALTNSEIVVTALPEQPGIAGYIITVYGSASGDAEVLGTAAASLSWALDAETTANGGVTPLTASDVLGPEEELWDAGEVAADDIDPVDFFWDDRAETPALTLSPPGGLVLYAAFTRPKKVSVPKNYVYCTTFTSANCKPKSLHDYCTWSPDKLGAADFRGPCARHDMSIDTVRKQGISVANKRKKRSSADSVFLTQLVMNCGYAHYQSKANRTVCYSAAGVYYTAVNAKTSSWNGK